MEKAILYQIRGVGWEKLNIKDVMQRINSLAKSAIFIN